ncbi:lipoprotein [Yersinia enterocolitica]|nr:lipoprotein [Yersinia enterocolitica]
MLNSNGHNHLSGNGNDFFSILICKESPIKKTAAVISALMLTFTLAACSSNYVMHTNDGRTIVADGKPKVDDETGMISYTDANGTEQQINRSEVKEMAEGK